MSFGSICLPLGPQLVLFGTTDRIKNTNTKDFFIVSVTYGFYSLKTTYYLTPMGFIGKKPT